MKKQNKEQELENILKNENNQFSMPLQKIVVSDLELIFDSLPKVKLIDIDTFQTNNYQINKFYKPISKIFDYRDGE